MGKFHEYEFYHCTKDRTVLVSWDKENFYDDKGNHFYRRPCTRHTGFVTDRMEGIAAEIFTTKNLHR
jgi:hypothetical protein